MKFISDNYLNKIINAFKKIFITEKNKISSNQIYFIKKIINKKTIEYNDKNKIYTIKPIEKINIEQETYEKNIDNIFNYIKTDTNINQYHDKLKKDVEDYIKLKNKYSQKQYEQIDNINELDIIKNIRNIKGSYVFNYNGNYYTQLYNKLEFVFDQKKKTSNLLKKIMAGMIFALSVCLAIKTAVFTGGIGIGIAIASIIIAVKDLHKNLEKFKFDDSIFRYIEIFHPNYIMNLDDLIKNQK